MNGWGKYKIILKDMNYVRVQTLVCLEVKYLYKLKLGLQLEK